MVALAVLLAMVTYLDRVCISTLADDISRDLGLTQMQMSIVFSAFTLAYAVFEIPTAWWADRAGTRNVLTRIVAWWSTFTIATAAAFSYTSLLVTRFLFGLGEAGAWPSVARTFSPLDSAERARTRAGDLFHGRTPGRRHHARAGAVAQSSRGPGARSSPCSARLDSPGPRSGISGSATTRPSIPR